MGVDVLGHVGLIYVSPTEPVRANRVVSWATYKRIVAALKRDGWNGAPVVILVRDHYDPPTPPLALTGSHRLAAAEELGMEVPCVDLDELCQSRGIDLDALLDPWLPQDAPCTDDALYRAVGRILRDLPIWLVTHYGLHLEFCAGNGDGAGHRHLCALDPEHYLEDDGWHRCVTCGEMYAATWWS